MTSHILLLLGLLLFAVLAVRVRRTVKAQRISGTVVMGDVHGNVVNRPQATERPSREPLAWMQLLNLVNVSLSIAAAAMVIASLVLG